MPSDFYGNYYWMIEVDESLANHGVITTVGDDVVISANGDLIVMIHSPGKDEEKTRRPGIIIPKGDWIVCYAASMITGDPVAVDHWETEKPLSKNGNGHKETEKGKMTPTLRYNILSRDGFRCKLCGRTAPEVKLHVDHIIPLSKGGKTEESNLQALCFDCNHGKARRLPE